MAANSVVYSFIMLYGILVFGDLLSELAELNRATRTEDTSKMERVQAAVEFMQGHDGKHMCVLNPSAARRTCLGGDLHRQEYISDGGVLCVHVCCVRSVCVLSVCAYCVRA